MILLIKADNFVNIPTSMLNEEVVVNDAINSIWDYMNSNDLDVPEIYSCANKIFRALPEGIDRIILEGNTDCLVSTAIVLRRKLKTVPIQYFTGRKDKPFKDFFC